MRSGWRLPNAARTCGTLLALLAVAQVAAVASHVPITEPAGADVALAPLDSILGPVTDALSAERAGPSGPGDGPSGPGLTTTTTPQATTTTPPTTVPPTGDPSLRTDTGLTRVRLAVDSAAAWMALDIVGAEIRTSRVVSTSGNARFVNLSGNKVGVNGDGRAVAELVLAVPHGADTALTMCKNYLGPVTVTVDRLTDGDARVATFLNSGTDKTVYDGCENPARHEVDRSALIGPVRWPARADPRPLVLANYYPWFDDAALEQDFGDQPVGPANTSDPDQVAAQVQLAAAHGIDGFIVEYDGTPVHQPGVDEVFRAANATRGRFVGALMLDFDILAHRNGGTVTAGVLDAALAAVAHHAANPSQLRVGDHPVVFLYGAGRVDPAWWSGALERLRASTGVVPFVIDQDGRLGAAGRYNYSTNTVLDAAGLARWSRDKLLQHRLEPGLAGRTGPLWVAPVSPGYDDRRLGRPQPVYVDRDGGRRYAQTWEAALGTLPDWVVVTTWNEYYEQTHVFPGTATGTMALTQTASWASRFHSDG